MIFSGTFSQLFSTFSEGRIKYVKESKSKFYETEQGKLLKQRFKRILIYSIILILFGIYMLIEAYTKKNSYAQYVYGTILIIFGIGFLISRSYVLMRKVNEYITAPKNTTKKM